MRKRSINCSLKNPKNGIILSATYISPWQFNDNKSSYIRMIMLTSFMLGITLKPNFPDQGKCKALYLLIMIHPDLWILLLSQNKELQLAVVEDGFFVSGS